MRGLKIVAVSCMFLALSILAKAQGLAYWVDVHQFKTSKGLPYLEIHTHIKANSLKYVSAGSGKFNASAELTLFLKNAIHVDADAIKVIIQSPVVGDTAEAIQELVLTDVRKIQADQGKNTVMGIIADANIKDKVELRFEKEIWIESNDMFSDVLFVNEMGKSDEKESPFFRFGYKAEPRLAGNSFTLERKLNYYVEFYGLNSLTKSSQYFVNTYITEKTTLNKLPGLTKTSKRIIREGMDLFFWSFDLSDLPTASYYLNVDLYDNRNKVIGSKSVEFVVINDSVSAYLPYEFSRFDELFAVNEPEIDFYFRPMKYIANPSEQDSIKYLEKFEAKKRFFYNFWDKRKEKESDNPADKFYYFKSRVELANKNYKSVYLDGWRTDRGRVLIMYGPPNNIDPFPAQMNGYPHEIWTYNRLGTQGNVTFVFVDWDLHTGDYNLIHSTKFGEINNPAWRFETLR